MMLRTGLALFAALAMLSLPIAAQAKAHHKGAHHAACKGSYMYMKGGKCLDARNKPAKA